MVKNRLICLSKELGDDWLDRQFDMIFLEEKMNEEKLQAENVNLKEKIKEQINEIENLKHTNQQHENEIETLLKFNERLLTIIETELNTQNSRKSERSFSLQPISEITERDSEVVDYVNPVGGVKSSNIYLKINDFDKERETTRKESGNVTDRVILGSGLEDQLSYEVSRSDYQREYSEYSQRDKYREVIALINAYKMEYGETIQECEEMKEKIKEDIGLNNEYMCKINEKNEQFYQNKTDELKLLKEKILNNTPDKELQTILKTKQYSVNTQNKLMKIMNSIQSDTLLS